MMYAHIHDLKARYYFFSKRFFVHFYSLEIYICSNHIDSNPQFTLHTRRACVCRLDYERGKKKNHRTLYLIIYASRFAFDININAQTHTHTWKNIECLRASVSHHSQHTTLMLRWMLVKLQRANLHPRRRRAVLHPAQNTKVITRARGQR